MNNWAERYRPKTLNEIVGNKNALTALKKWAISWERGRPQKKAVILSGDPGVGKTTAANALAKDMNWTVVELNASDARNYAVVKDVAMRGAVHQTFDTFGNFQTIEKGGRKLIILDEADNLYEGRASGRAGASDLSDRGGKRAIIETISKTQQPIILIVNDQYGLTKGQGAALKNMCQIIRFYRPEKGEVRDLLRTMAIREKIDVEAKAIDIIAERSEGDVRGAINDLELLAIGRRTVSAKDTEVIGHRDPKQSIFEAMDKVFKTKSLTLARSAMMNVDETPEDLILWLDENIPREYTDVEDLVNAYDMLSRADIFLGRVYRRQHFRMMAYASDLMSGGVCTAKKDVYRGPSKVQFPMYLIRMSRSKQDRAHVTVMLGKLQRGFHLSRTKAQEVLPDLRVMCRNDVELAMAVTKRLELDELDLALVIDDEEKAAHIVADVEAGITFKKTKITLFDGGKKDKDRERDKERLKGKEKETEKDREKTDKSKDGEGRDGGDGIEERQGTDGGAKDGGTEGGKQRSLMDF